MWWKEKSSIRALRKRLGCRWSMRSPLFEGPSTHLSPRNIHYRAATLADVVEMARCRLADPAAGPADPRMAAYLEGKHHPRQALTARIAYVALVGERVV